MASNGNAIPVSVDDGTEPRSNHNERRRSLIVAVEEEDSDVEEDVIPPSGCERRERSSTMDDSTEHNDKDKKGLASRRDLNMPANEFAEGCKLLQAAALGNKAMMVVILHKRPRFIDFRDYDRRTALHVAASEGHLEICQFLVERGARINRSDR
jgi:ankyrin repeat protein